MRAGVGSPAARSEMRRIMDELGYLEEQDRIDEADKRPPAPKPAKPAEEAAEEPASDAEESDGEELERRRQPGVTSTGGAAGSQCSMHLFCFKARSEPANGGVTSHGQHDVRGLASSPAQDRRLGKVPGSLCMLVDGKLCHNSGLT